MMYVHFFPDHRIVFVVGVVGVAELAIGSKFKLQKFVAELAFVAHVVTDVKILRHYFLIELSLSTKTTQ